MRLPTQTLAPAEQMAEENAWQAEGSLWHLDGSVEVPIGLNHDDSRTQMPCVWVPEEDDPTAVRLSQGQWR